MKKVFIGLGSNLQNPLYQVVSAIEKIKSHNDICLLATSSLYKSRPVGPQDQSDFINAVILIETKLKPENLLNDLQIIEKLHSRVRLKKWGPRTLDLDILMFENIIMKTKKLIIPHPEITNRQFVLMPLLEITHQNFNIPLKGKIKKYI